MKSFATIVAGVLACCTSATASSVSVDHAFGVDGDFRKRGSMELLIDSKTATLPAVKLSADAAEMEVMITSDGDVLSPERFAPLCQFEIAMWFRCAQGNLVPRLVHVSSLFLGAIAALLRQSAASLCYLLIFRLVCYYSRSGGA